MRGARTLALAVVLAVVASACGVLPGGGGGRIQVTAYFERAVSLYDGSQVRVLGLPAGTVDEVEVEGDLVRVDLSVPTDVPLPADAQATIVPLSLIGERFVQIFPAYTGGPKMEDGAVIPIERTSVPVEPDEALRSLRDLLDDLNPEGTRRLTENLAEDLEGQGEALNATIRELGELSRDFGEKSETLGEIIDSFDEFTTTLVRREEQIGEVLDDFASITAVLAEERDHLANTISNLARFAADAKDLVEEHGSSLGDDLETLEHVAQSIQANLDAIADLLDAGPVTASGLKNAYNPENDVVMLRDNGELAAGDGSDASSAGSGEGAGTPNASGAAPGDEAVPPDDSGSPPLPETPFQPLDELLDELLEEGDGPLELGARSGDRARSGPERVAAGLAGFFGRLGGFARSVVGVA